MKRGGLAPERRTGRDRLTLTTQIKPLFTHGGFSSLLGGYT
jgi:hypothetical protein